MGAPAAFTFPLTPAPPAWELPWAALEALPWLRPLDGCAQSPRHHGEGDVLVHTRLVAEALAGAPAWRALPAARRELLFCAALMHDLGKPQATRREPGRRPGDPPRLTTRGHGARGAVLARELLMSGAAPLPGPCPFVARLELEALVALHNLPMHAINTEDPRRRVLAASLVARGDHLALLSRADALGRRCDDQAELLERVALFEELCRDDACLDRPYAFPDDHTRFTYFNTGGRRPPDQPAYDDTWGPVLLMCGLPGAGKDHWIRHHGRGRPVVSLDDLRREMGVTHRQEQGGVVQAARQRARAHLRARRPFIWNATNLTRGARERLIQLFSDYKARVELVYVERPLALMQQANRARRDPVPDAVVDRFLRKLRVPDLTEAHAVRYIHVDPKQARPPWRGE